MSLEALLFGSSILSIKYCSAKFIIDIRYTYQPPVNFNGNELPIILNELKMDIRMRKKNMFFKISNEIGAPYYLSNFLFIGKFVDFNKFNKFELFLTYYSVCFNILSLHEASALFIL